MECGETRIARLAQHHAEPIVEDLIPAAQMPHVADVYREPVAGTGEDMVTLFVRLVIEFTKWMPMLCRPTVSTLARPGSWYSISKRSALKAAGRTPRRPASCIWSRARSWPATFSSVPPTPATRPSGIGPIASPSFAICGRRPSASATTSYTGPRAASRSSNQIVLDQREGRTKVRIGLSSQRLADFPPHLAELATSIYICGLGKEETVEDAMQRFGLRESSRYVLRSRLFGPEQKHGANPVFGAPFLASWTLDNRVGRVEQMLYNMLGPTELWALTTRPDDVDLRDRLYDALGHRETWRRLAVVFPTGSAAGRSTAARTR